MITAMTQFIIINASEKLLIFDHLIVNVLHLAFALLLLLELTWIEARVSFETGSLSKILFFF